MDFNYDEFSSRNSGYITQDVQDKLSQLNVLIAGCGIGSQVAVSLTRLGIQNFILFDGDTVSLTNLNRQAFKYSQINLNKSTSLKENIIEINPFAKVNAINGHFDSKLHSSLLKNVDLIIDTIDFLNMKDIILLHEAAEENQIPLITGMSAGFGANVILFKNNTNAKNQFRKIFNIPISANLDEISYVDNFIQIFQKMSAVIDPNVVHVMTDVFKKLADNIPCPAPQVIGGAICLASTITFMVKKIVSDEQMPSSPKLISVNMDQAILNNNIELI